MESPIDVSKRKPRRTRGTPSFQFRNRFSYAFIAGGIFTFSVWSYTPIFRAANEHFKKFLVPTEEELERNALFSLPRARSGQYIKDNIEDKKKFTSER